jgi:hypothetical protein
LKMRVTRLSEITSRSYLVTLLVSIAVL